MPLVESAHPLPHFTIRTHESRCRPPLLQQYNTRCHSPGPTKQRVYIESVGVLTWLTRCQARAEAAPVGVNLARGGGSHGSVDGRAVRRVDGVH